MDRKATTSPERFPGRLYRSPARALRRVLRAVAVVYLAVTAGVAAAQSTGGWHRCGSIDSGPGIYGPYDYRFDKDRLPLVENAHFTPNVEHFRERITGPFGGDISYTLIAFPNHHRALAAIVRLSEREGREKPVGAKFSVECYFDRAIRFRPDDGTVRLLHGLYLMKKERNAQAVEELTRAQQLSGDDPNIHYNLGLVFLRMKRYDDALMHAHKAYKGGFELPGLKNLLTAAGAWKDPE